MTDTPLSAVDEIARKLRVDGWSVAVHNDYRLNGEPHTFWLWTHPNGRWIKGEGKTDAEALSECYTRISSLEASGEVAVKELEWKLIGRAWIAETDIGDYEVSVFELEGVSTRLITPFDRTGVWFRTDKDAKAAAQADFSRRIRSALVPQPAVPDPSPAPEEPGAAEVEAFLAKEILQRVRKLKIAENDHAKKIAVDECSTSRDEADLHHAKLLRFTLADIDRAIRSLRPSSREQVLAEAAAAFPDMNTWSIDYSPAGYDVSIGRNNVASGHWVSCGEAQSLDQAFRNAMAARRKRIAEDANPRWPRGCIKPGSCERAKRCNYANCRWQNVDIAPQIADAIEALAKKEPSDG